MENAKNAKSIVNIFGDRVKDSLTILGCKIRAYGTKRKFGGTVKLNYKIETKLDGDVPKLIHVAIFTVDDNTSIEDIKSFISTCTDTFSDISKAGRSFQSTLDTHTNII